MARTSKPKVAVLEEPPWLSAPTVEAAPILAGLQAPEVAPSLRWQEGERERFAAEGDAVAAHKLDEAAQQDFVDVTVHGKSPSGPYPWAHACYLFQISPARAVKIWNHVPPQEWIQVGWAGLPGWLLAHHGLWVLPGLVALARRAPQHALPWLGPVRDTTLAPIMASAMARLKSVRHHAHQWLVRHADVAAVALVPAALGKRGKDREAAEGALRLVMGEVPEVMLAIRASYGFEVQAAIDAFARDAPAKPPIKPPKIPRFVSLSRLPVPTLVDGEPLSKAALKNLVMLLALAGPDGCSAEIQEVRVACEPRSLAALAWAIASAWLLAGAPNEDKWALYALGHFGDDVAARKLADLVRGWPGQAMHARAVLGLEVLAMIGSDVALMHVHGIAQRIRFKGLEDRARETIDAIATARGLSAEELADRLVPDLGFDPTGCQSFDYGARAIVVAMQADGSLRVGGSARSTLPDAEPDDDAERVRAAQAAFKTLREDLRRLLPAQRLRLELAMAARRSWSMGELRRFVLAHPIVGHLARGLVWGVVDGAGTLTGTARVLDDALVDIEGRPVTVSDAQRVVVLHPMSATNAVCAQWCSVLRAACIVPPFEQLERATFVPSELERLALSVTDFEGSTVPTGAILGLLQRGWRRGAPQTSGASWWLDRPMPGGLVAQLRIAPGLVPGAPPPPSQTLGVITFVRDDEEQTIGEVDPIVYSETVRDVVALRARKASTF